MSYVQIYLHIVLKLKTVKHINITKFTTSMFQDWEQLGIVIKQG